MAGDYQHYLQQMLQRGFKRPNSGKHPTIWEYRKNTPPNSPRRIAKIGAENHFYSPKSDGTYTTLDDKITEWENARQADVRAWRNYKNGQSVDAEKAAKLVGLTGVRTQSVRDVFTTIIEKTLFGFGDIIKNPDVLISHLNNQSSGFGEQVREEISKILARLPQNLHSYGEMEQEINAVSRMVSYSLAENISAVLTKELRESDRLFREVFDDNPIDIALEHKESLSKFFDKGAKRDDLYNLSWLIVHRQHGEPWVLPDCAVLNIDKSGLVSPFIFGSKETRSAIVLPLSPDRILIGLSDKENMPDLRELDQQSVQCSNKFFLSAERSDRLSELCEKIGERHMADIDKGLENAISVVNPFKPNVHKDEITFTVLEAISISSYNLDIKKEILIQKANSFAQTLLRFSNQWHISNLKKVIVCDSISAAVLDLRDINLGELTNGDPEAYFYQFPYDDENEIAYELYVQANVFDIIINPENEHFDFCLNILLQSLLQIHTREIFFQKEHSLHNVHKIYERPELGVLFANLSLNAATKFLAVRHAGLISPLEDAERKALCKKFLECLLHWSSLTTLYSKVCYCYLRPLI